jgi:hypothetical protein
MGLFQIESKSAERFLIAPVSPRAHELIFGGPRSGDAYHSNILPQIVPNSQGLGSRLEQTLWAHGQGEDGG